MKNIDVKIVIHRPVDESAQLISHEVKQNQNLNNFKI